MLQERLEELVRRYSREYLETDPIRYPHRYSREEDIVVAGLLSALLAFGGVKQIFRSLDDLFRIIGPRPHDFVANLSRQDRKKFDGFSHRFVRGDDVYRLLAALSALCKEKGGIRGSIVSRHRKGKLVESVSSWVRSVKGALPNPAEGLSFLLPDPAGGSACKRLFLFMRWMVRRGDGIDFGIFREISPSELVIPLDTHVARISRLLGLTRRKTATLSTALEVTESLRRFDPDDPVKFDFALSRIGIVKGCRGVNSSACADCLLRGYCIASRAEEDEVP